MTRWILGVLVATCAFTGDAAELKDRLSDAKDGATCDYFNRGAGGAWQRRGGDWLDASAKMNGDDAYGSVTITSKAAASLFDIDVTRLVAEWASQKRNPAHGLMIRSIGARHGTSDIASRESSDPSRRPVLLIVARGGEQQTIPAAADAYLDCTSEKGLGTQNRMKVSRGVNAILRFDLPSELDPRTVSKAALRFEIVKQYGDSVLGVFASYPSPSPDIEPRQGLAASYPDDAGIGKDPNVWFATGFESRLWQSEWTEYDPRSETAIIDNEADLGFTPLLGKALRVTLVKGKNLGLDLRYLFQRTETGEPDEAYFRYYLRFAKDWTPDVDGGKLPGFAGTYGRAGWGMRKSTGSDGWSMRGCFFIQPSAENPYHSHTPVGTYAYHLDLDGPSGEGWRWPLGRLAALERNRWYSVEQYFKVNTPGKSDGVLRAWIGGRLVFERTDIRVRTTTDLKIESVWFNVYHGGVTPPPRDMHLYIDNVVIAKKYIGPMRRAR